MNWRYFFRRSVEIIGFISLAPIREIRAGKKLFSNPIPYANKYIDYGDL